MPLHLIAISFGLKFKFHSNIKKKTSLKKLLPFYREIFINWKTHFSSSPETLFGRLLFAIQIEDNPVCLTNVAAKNIDFLSELFEEGSLKPWDDIKIEFNLTNETYFRILVMSAIFLSKTIILLKEHES